MVCRQFHMIDYFVAFVFPVRNDDDRLSLYELLHTSKEKKVMKFCLEQYSSIIQAGGFS